MTKLRAVSGNIPKFLTNFGFDNGNRFTFILEKMFNAKGISPKVTFEELYEITKIKLIITTVCMNTKQVYYLSHLSFPKLPVILGLRMTASVPFWFTPVRYDNKLFMLCP